MFRVVSLICLAVVGVLASGVPEVAPNVTLSPGNLTTEPISQGALANELKAELGSKKDTLDKDLSAVNKGNETTREVPVIELVNVTSVASEEGPQKVKIVELKREEFPHNESKEVVITETAEKLPSNETVKETTIERKTVTVNDTETDKPVKDVVTEVEVATRVCGNHTGEYQEPTITESDLNHAIEKALALLRQVQVKAKEIEDPCLTIDTAKKVEEKELEETAVELSQEISVCVYPTRRY
ncbi:hypothetical protein GWK47_046577 [Chionoecetes opilio]|uniref:Uncharacterized protein n=1 Tax=Chionoecetes opilio TaxID=41210 RepID=A0A8J4Y6B0_CHIOP|nr:hypothetical protein GWK47_046577 [Chionoecetes opilio]